MPSSGQIIRPGTAGSSKMQQQVSSSKGFQGYNQQMSNSKGFSNANYMRGGPQGNVPTA